MQANIFRLKVFHFNRGKPSHNETRLQIQMQATRSPVEKRRKLSKLTERDDCIVVSVSFAPFFTAVNQEAEQRKR